MYLKKKVILKNQEGSALTFLSLSGNPPTLRVELTYSPTSFDFLLVSDHLHVQEFHEKPVHAYFDYTEGVIECALVKDGKILALGDSDGGVRCTKIREYLATSKKEEVAKVIPSFSQSEEIAEKEEGVRDTSQEEEIPITPPKEEFIEIPQNKNADISSQNTDVAEFYCSVKKNLDEMFTCYPEEKILKDIIPESDWIRVTRGDGHYVVGVIKEDNRPRYVCYGVPAKVGHLPPQKMQKYCEWLPTSPDDTEGYWIVFQDAKSGRTLANED